MTRKNTSKQTQENNNDKDTDQQALTGYTETETEYEGGPGLDTPEYHDSIKWKVGELKDAQ